MTTTVDAQRLRALVAAVHAPGDRRRVVVVRADPIWDGDDVLSGEPPVRVAPCASPLAVRAALADFAASDDAHDAVLTVLTQCSDRDLGPDVLARVAKGRVLSVDPFSALLALFRARTIDPLLVHERWLIDDLIAVAPPGGWPQERPTNGVIDADRAWEVWQRHRLAGVDAPRTLAGLVQLGDDPPAANAIANLPEEHRSRLASRWLGGVSPVAVMLERIAAGDGGHLAQLGLVADVLWMPTDDPALAALQSVGRARLETHFGRDAIDTAAARRWADAAHEVLTGHPSAPAVTTRADEILADAGVSELAELSDWLPHGFDLRLTHLAEPLARGDAAAAQEQLDRIEAHVLAERRRPRVDTARAAVRLARRATVSDRASARTFGEAVESYRHDGAWVDDARSRLAEGDAPAPLAAEYATWCAAVDDERRTAARDFARLLCDWSASEPIEDPRFVPVEQVLDRVVAPIAFDVPVLVLVCDGMGLPVAHELLHDLAGEGWTDAAPAHVREWPTGVAMLPTVTEVSRASLLAGRRVEGGQAEERAGFESHPSLRQRSRPGLPPRLFHKAQLVGPDGRSLPEDVRAVVADPAQRVVGAVVNAVDDHLNRGQQVRVQWGLDSMRPLIWLLEAANEVGRVVVVTADHGHVVHGDGAVLRPPAELGGERWRPAAPATPASDDEIEVSGPRVLKGGRVVLPFDERVRYGGHKHGYHGGATPQEVLVPIAVLARSLPEGWEHRPIAVPAWWSERTSVIVEVPPPATSRARSRPAADERAQPQLFEASPVEFEEPAANEPSLSAWIDVLLRAPSFVAHRTQVRLPRPLDDDRITKYLAAIAANNNSIPLAALAERTGEPADQLRMVLAVVQRLLNLDGAAILTIGADQSVTLDRSLLALQFGIDGA